MGLAEPGRAVDEERVVGLAGLLGDGERGGVGEAVAVADHELLEGVACGLRARSGSSSGRRRRDGAPACRPPPAASPRRRARPWRLVPITSRAAARMSVHVALAAPSCGCGSAPARRACRRSLPAGSSGSSQMWKVKSGHLARGARLRMAVPRSSVGLVGHGRATASREACRCIDRGGGDRVLVTSSSSEKGESTHWLFRAAPRWAADSSQIARAKLVPRAVNRTVHTPAGHEAAGHQQPRP